MTQVTAAEFERRYAERCDLTVEEHRAMGRFPAPCICEDEGCEGWQMISIDSWVFGLDISFERQRTIAALQRIEKASAPQPIVRVNRTTRAAVDALKGFGEKAAG